MPRTRSLAWSELKIGVVTIAAIVIAAALAWAAAELTLGPMVMVASGSLAMGYLTMEAIGDKR